MNVKVAKFPAAARGIALAVSAISIGISQAEEVSVKLSGAEETPPVTTSAKGTAKLSIGADRSVAGKAKTTGMEGIAAHIHVGAPGLAGPPIITLVKGENGEWTVPPGAKLTDEQFASYKAGDLYINVHSPEHKPGEIRGQLKP